LTNVRFGIQGVPTKKKEKRTLETFLEKPNVLSQRKPTPSKTYLPRAGLPGDHSYKKERERTLAMFFLKETPSHPKLTFQEPVQGKFQEAVPTKKKEKEH
jgi:hypothetical protein